MAKLSDHEANEVIKDYIYYRKICEDCNDTEVKSLKEWLKNNGYNIEDLPIDIEVDNGRMYTYKGRLFSTKKLTEVINDIAKEVGKTSKTVIKNIAYKGAEGLKDTNIKGDYKFDIRKAIDTNNKELLNTLAKITGQETMQMRDLTPEERKMSKEALSKISKPTGLHIDFGKNTENNEPKYHVSERIVSDTGIEEVVSVGSNDTYTTKTILSKDQFIEAYNKYVKPTLDIPKDLDEQEKDIDEALRRSRQSKIEETVKNTPIEEKKEDKSFVFPYSYEEIIDFATKNNCDIVLNVVLDYEYRHITGISYNVGRYSSNTFTNSIYDAMVCLYYKFIGDDRIQDLTTYKTTDELKVIQIHHPELFRRYTNGKISDVKVINLPKLPLIDTDNVSKSKFVYPTNLQSIDILFKRREHIKADHIEFKKLDEHCFPHAGMLNLAFKLKDGRILTGRYGFNDTYARRWIDEDGNEYSSNLVESWAQL